MENEPRNQHPNGLLLDEVIYSQTSAVNGHGDVIDVKYLDNAFKVISNTGITKEVELPEPRESKVIDNRIAGIAVDSNSNVYVVRCLETSMRDGGVRSYVLDLLDENYHVKQEWMLDFLKNRLPDVVRIAINKNDNIIIIRDADLYVYSMSVTRLES